MLMKPHFNKQSSEETFFAELSGQAKMYFEKSGKSRYGNSFVLWKGIFFLSAIVVLYALLLTTTGFTIALYMAFGFVIAQATFNFAHDACHQSLSRHKKLNNIVFYFLFNLQGVSAYLWKKRHLESHHVHANVEGADVDLEDTQLVRLHPASEYKSRHRFQHIYAPFLYLVYTLNWVFIKDLKLIFRQQHGSLKMKHSAIDVFKLFAVKLIYLFIFIFIPWSVTGLSLQMIFLCFLVMHAFVSLFISFTFLISHYCMEVQMPTASADGAIDNSWMRHQVEISADFHAESKWAIHLFGGFNTHVAHHLFPSVCHVHYPALTRIIKSTLATHTIPYHEFSFFKGIVSHFRLLKKLSQPQICADLNTDFE
jgi:linoleoyl-CoA desaturase